MSRPGAARALAALCGTLGCVAMAGLHALSSVEAPGATAARATEAVEACPPVACPPAVCPPSPECPALEAAAPTTPPPAAARILFGTSSARTVDDGVLQPFARWLSGHPDDVLVIGGHADPVGDERANEALSWSRAHRVRRQLVAQGVDPRQLCVAGFGSQFALTDGGGVAASRRVDVRITSGP